MGHHRRKNKHKHETEQVPSYDFNSLGNMNLGSLFQILSSIDISQLSGLLSQIKIDPNDERNILKEGDPRIDLLNSLKPFLPPDKTTIVDEVIRVFSPKPNNAPSNPTNPTSESASANSTPGPENTTTID